MKNWGIISIFCLIAVIYTGCSAYRDAPDYAVDDCHHERITGKVLKVWDKNTVLVELTEDGEHHSVGDKLLVNYEQMSVNDLYDEMEGLKNVDPDYQPVVGDIVVGSVRGMEQKDGYEYVDTYELVKYVEDSKGVRIVSGDIIEVQDQNTVLINITRERGGYRVGDKVILHYDTVGVYNTTDQSKGTRNRDPDYQPVIGDYVYARVESVEKQKEYDYLTTKELTKYEEEYVED